MVEVVLDEVVETKRALSLFLDPSPKENARFLEDVKRIEFRISGEFAEDVVEKFRDDASWGRGFCR